MKNYLVCLLLACAGCNSCKKEIETRTYFLDQGIKDWMYFKKGTYWVYKDSLTGAEDSAWVDTSYIKMVWLDDNKTRPYNSSTETFYVEIKRTIDIYIYIYERFNKLQKLPVWGFTWQYCKCK